MVFALILAVAFSSAEPHVVGIDAAVPSADEGLLLGNGGFCCSVFQTADEIVFRFGRNDVWDRRVDLSRNPKLKYFYCHNNHIAGLDTRTNPLLRHLNATGNPMKSIRSLAPQREEKLPLEVYAGDGGCVGLKFNPVYNAQWKETGEWQQSYYAYPDDGFRFDGWYEDGTKISGEETWIDEYGTSRILQARFKTIL